jgi:hypothetical protein
VPDSRGLGPPKAVKQEAGRDGTRSTHYTLSSPPPQQIPRAQSSPEPSNSLPPPVMAADPSPNAPQSSFTMALSMLLYDVS